MTARRRPLVVIASLVAAAALTGGCAASSSGDAPVGVLDPQRLATTATLTIDAFPPPWTAARTTPPSSGFDRCPTVAAALASGRAARATSPEFTDGPAEQLAESVAVYRTDADARQVMTTIRSDAFGRCLETLLVGAAPARPRAARASATATLEPARQVGDDRVSYRVLVARPAPAGAGAPSRAVVLDVMRQGRTVVSLLDQRAGGSPTADRTRLLEILVARIRNANGL